MVRKCRFCKAQENLNKLTPVQLKLARRISPVRVTADDVFCGICRDKINKRLLKVLEKQRKRKSNTQSSLSGSQADDSSLSILSSITNREGEEESRNTPPRKMTRQSTEAEQRVPDIASSEEIIETNVTTRSNRQTRQTRNNNDETSSGEAHSSELIPFQIQSQLPQTQASSSQTSSSQQTVPPIIPEVVAINAQIAEEPDESSDDEDRIGIHPEIPGSRAIQNVQPLIRRRRKRVVFPDERNVPIFNRSNFGG